MPVRIHRMEVSHAGEGLLLAGQKKGRGLKLAGGEMVPVKRGRGRPRKSQEGGDMLSGLLASTWKRIKRDPKGSMKLLGQALDPGAKGNIWSSAKTVLQSKDAADARKKLGSDKMVMGLASILPYGSDQVKGAYKKNVQDAPISTNFGDSIEMAKELNEALKSEILRITGKEKPDTFGAIASGDLDQMEQKAKEFTAMYKSDPRIKSIIDTETMKVAVRWNKKPERVEQKLWLDPATLKEYNADEAVRQRDLWNNSDIVRQNPDLAAAPNPVKGSGLRLAGGGGCMCGCGCCEMAGRGLKLAGRGLKLAGHGVGGSRNSGYILKQLKEGTFDISKMKEPSEDLKKKFAKKRGRKPKTAQIAETPVASRTRARQRGKGASPWIAHVKDYAKQHQISYKRALSEAGASFKK